MIYVLGGGTRSVAHLLDDYTIRVEVQQNSFDFTGLIAILDFVAEAPHVFNASHYFYLHDTCEVGPTFWQRLMAEAPFGSSFYPYPRGGKNIGVYSLQLLQASVVMLRALRNDGSDAVSLQRFKQTGTVMEGILFLMDPTAVSQRDAVVVSFFTPVDVYRTGVPRIRECFAGLDMVKYTANWVFKQSYELRT